MSRQQFDPLFEQQFHPSHESYQLRISRLLLLFFFLSLQIQLINKQKQKSEYDEVKLYLALRQEHARTGTNLTRDVFTRFIIGYYC